MEAKLTDILNSHTMPLRVTACSKWWWTPEVAGKSKKYGWTQRMYQQKRASRFTIKTAKNTYYYMV